MGACGYVFADLLTLRPGEVIFEAGSGPESTPYLTTCAAATGAELVSVDIATGVDAEQFLADWDRGRCIRFAYLDSYDWPYANLAAGDLRAYRRQYEARGQAPTEDASAEHHLRVAKLLVDLLVVGSMVVFDDTWPTPDGWDGKGRDAVPFLLARGAEVAAMHRDEGPHRSGRNAFYVALFGPLPGGPR